MATQTTSNGQIVRNQQQKPGASLTKFIEDHAGDFAMVLPKHMTPERMVRLAISAVRTSPQLAQCSVVSFASCIMACATLGLEPNTPLGHAYLIPRKNKGKTECTLQIGYQGLKELMYRSGAVASVKAEAVYEGDVFEFEKGLAPKLRHVPSGEDNPAKLTHVYTIVRWKDGGEPIWDVLTRKQIEARARRGGSYNSGHSPWKTDFEAMALKTGVRAIAKWAPSSTERSQLQQAIGYEDATDMRRPGMAVAALGEKAEDALTNMGAFPTADDDGEAVTADGEIVSDTDNDVPMREPGDD